MVQNTAPPAKKDIVGRSKTDGGKVASGASSKCQEGSIDLGWYTPKSMGGLQRNDRSVPRISANIRELMKQSIPMIGATGDVMTLKHGVIAAGLGMTVIKGIFKRDRKVVCSKRKG